MATVFHPSGPTWLALVLAGLTAIGSLYMNYIHNDRDTAQRVSALEANQASEHEKVDHIQVQVDKLVEWALGKK